MVRQIRAGVGPAVAPRIAAAFPAYAGPHRNVALSALDEFIDVKNRDGTAHLPTGSRNPARPATAADLVQRGLALIGSPDEVARQVALVAATGITDLFAMPDFGALPPELVVPSLRALAGLAHLGES
jgi:alkanesulfonate monooxygenase SsuD/methylene tetrahydromethanopterin reductase-like flavin-dependent oxidoreductase (luciferase family)